MTPIQQLKNRFKDRLPERFVRTLHHARMPLSSAENELDDEAARAVVRVCLSRSERVLVDVGAHRGEILRAAVEAAPQREHHAFEPGAAADYLRLRFPTICVHQCCVGGQGGVVDYFIYSRDTRKSTHHVEDEDLVAQTRVAQVALDEAVGSVAIGVLKVDVEGAELDVLKGAERILKVQRPTVIFEHGAPGGKSLDTSGPLYDLLIEARYRISPLRGARIASRYEFRQSVERGAAWNFLGVPSEI